ncbi:MAG: hypothetical protein IPP01_06655 [Saprospiraceae bacterium]|nr:hypothetical protein [Saprospiraceae bacterium]
MKYSEALRITLRVSDVTLKLENAVAFFSFSKSCLQADQLLASPVTEVGAKLALFSCKFCDRNEGTGLALV